jgi:hypothetical protein
MSVIGVDDERNPFSDEGVGDRVYFYLCRVGDLFDTRNDEH